MRRPRWVESDEWMDAPDLDAATVEWTLRDLRRVNRWLGGAALTLGALETMTRRLPRGSELSVLDVATGAADIPAAIASWARRRGLRARVVASDFNARLLARAERAPGVALAVADARALPFPARSFDVVTCSLALHHLLPDEAPSMLREMARVARRAVVVNDLMRTWLGLAGAWAVSRLFTRNAVTRHDAPLSVRRAYTRREVEGFAERAGLRVVRFRSFLGYRMAMTAVPS